MIKKKAILTDLVLVFSFLICIFAVAMLEPCHAASSIVLTQKNPAYTMQLKSNATTGYSWQMESYDSRLLTVDHRYVVSQTQLIGAGGREVWTFRATEEALKTAPHDIVIKLVYVRPWEWEKNKQVSPENVRILSISIQ